MPLTGVFAPLLAGPALARVERLGGQERRRRRVDQPWSLILQLLAILCLLLAIAQPRWGTRLLGGRDHVLLLDTSSWMGAPASDGDLSTQARRSALRWMRALPSQDRVMVVRAGAEALPATRFESDRSELEAAIRAVMSRTFPSISMRWGFSRLVPRFPGRAAIPFPLRTTWPLPWPPKAHPSMPGTA